MQTQTWDDAELERLEDAVTAGEGVGIVGRWESGRYLLQHKRGKQLPNQLRATLKERFGLPAWEVTARMKLAHKCRTKDEVVACATTFKSWNRIRREFLIDEPRKKMPAAISPFARLIDSVREFDQAAFVPGDEEVVSQLETEFPELIQRFRRGMKFLDVPRRPRKQRFPRGAQFAGDLFHLIKTPGEYDPHVVEETARQAFAYHCDVEGTTVDEPSHGAVQQFKAEFVKLVEAHEHDDGYVIGQPIWQTAASLAVKELLAAGVR